MMQYVTTLLLGYQLQTKAAPEDEAYLQSYAASRYQCCCSLNNYFNFHLAHLLLAFSVNLVTPRHDCFEYVFSVWKNYSCIISCSYFLS